MKTCLYCGALKVGSSDYCLTHTVECKDCGSEFELKREKLKKGVLVCVLCVRKRHSERMKRYAKEGRVGFKLESNQKAAQEAVLRKYGVSNVSQDPTIRAKVESTMLERYGSKSPFGSEEVRRKIAATNLEKYGAENPFASETVKEKIKESNIERYGVDNYMKNPEMRARQVATLVKNHGVESPLQSASIHERQKATMLERYGVKNPAQVDHVRQSRSDGMRLMTDEEFLTVVTSLASCDPSGKVSAEEIRSKTPYGTRGSIYKKVRELGIEDLVEYSGESQINVYWKLLIESKLGVTLKTEGAIFPEKRWKCDLYSEERKVGIDINPTISHSTQKVHPIYPAKSTNYHQKRALAAEENGWLLYQIYDWDDEAAVLSQLRNLLGLNTERYYARLCEVRPIEKSKASEFLREHHRQGNASVGSVFYGLYHKEELVQVMTFSKGRFKNPVAEWELLRLASKGTVAGGASKLFKAFVKDYEPKSVMSYASLDTGHGKVYEKLGFGFAGLTALNALYSKPETREAMKVTTCSKKFGKEYQKLGKTQQEFMNAMGFYRINDAGSKLFLWPSVIIDVTAREEEQ